MISFLWLSIIPAEYVRQKQSSNEIELGRMQMFRESKPSAVTSSINAKCTKKIEKHFLSRPQAVFVLIERRTLEKLSREFHATNLPMDEGKNAFAKIRS